MKLVHKGAAYLILLTGAIAVFFGINVYRTNPKHLYDFPFEILHISFYIVVLGAFEILFRISNSKEDVLEPTGSVLSSTEFSEKVKNGE